MAPGTPLIHVVDDDESFRVAIARLLRAAGYEVREYESTEEFLASGADREPGCVLADLRMPGRGGLELQAELARAESPMPVVLLSAFGDIPTTVRAMREGAVDFLTKPVRRVELIAAIDRALLRDAAERARRVGLEVLRGRFETLSPREREVLVRVVTGRLNKQIASELGIVVRTVKAHRASVMAKLQARSVADLVRIVEALGKSRSA